MLSTVCDDVAATAAAAVTARIDAGDELVNQEPLDDMNSDSFDSFDAVAAAELLLLCCHWRNWNWGCCAQIVVGIPTFQCGLLNGLRSASGDRDRDRLVLLL